MKFLVDRCAGHTLAEWLRNAGHDVVEARDRGPDPGDELLLQWAADESRILLTIDFDFGRLVFVDQHRHHGLVRIPNVRSEQRIAILSSILEKHHADLAAAAVITVRGGRIRVSRTMPRTA